MDGVRAAVLDRLAELVGGTAAPLVAIDGPDAAGKTTLARELACVLREGGREVVEVSLDGFHRPAAERLARGPLSPEGYVDDSFDLEALRRDVLAPVGERASEPCTIVPARFDWQADAPVAVDPLVVPAEACVLVEGVFLHRRELADTWSSSVFVFAEPEAVLERARVRDAAALGGADEVERRYAARYLPGQALYFRRDAPHVRATVCLENTEPAEPLLSAPAVAEGVERWIEAYGGC